MQALYNLSTVDLVRMQLIRGKTGSDWNMTAGFRLKFRKFGCVLLPGLRIDEKSKKVWNRLFLKIPFRECLG